MDNIKYSIAENYTRTPGPRNAKEGKFSGEHFRDTILKTLVETAIESGSILEINLDGTAGYGTSFLEEAFGGLVRTYKMNANKILLHVRFISNEEPFLIDDVNQYITEAYEELDNK